jgi:hypothetical protein
MTTPELVSLLKKNPIIVVCGALSLAIVGAIYFRSGAIEEANATLEQKSIEGNRYTQNVTNGVQLKEQLDALTAANAVIESRLIRASELGINQQFFFKLESDSGVKLAADLHQGGKTTPSPNAKYVPIGFTLSAQGNFSEVLAFLRGLEDGTHYCRVVTASCSGGRKGLVAITLNLELLGRP